MSIRIEERFEVNAPRERVWRYLADPHQVVACLPGAELTGEESADVYLGKVKVKVGPIVASYAGKATVLERDESAGVMRLSGEGRESGGSGSAKMTLTMRVLAIDSVTSAVEVTADLDIVGKIVQFGRGMIESVNKQLFKQFVACVQQTLATGATSDETRATSERVPDGSPSASAAQTVDGDDDDVPFPLPPSGEFAVRTDSLQPTMAFRAMPRPVPTPAVAAPPVQSGSTPVKIIPLLFAILRDWIAKFFRR